MAAYCMLGVQVAEAPQGFRYLLLSKSAWPWYVYVVSVTPKQRGKRRKTKKQNLNYMQDWKSASQLPFFKATSSVTVL